MKLYINTYYSVFQHIYVPSIKYSKIIFFSTEFLKILHNILRYVPNVTHGAVYRYGLQNYYYNNFDRVLQFL